MSNKSNSWLTGILAQTVAAIAIVLWTAILIPLTVIGLLVVAVVWVAAMAWEWLTSRAVPLGHDLFDLFFLMRYLVTGNCGQACSHVTFYRSDTGELTRPFVPEAGCPVHDSDTQLSQLVQKMKKEN